MKKYKVVTFNVETKNGKNAEEKWLDASIQETETVGIFKSLNEAKQIYEEIESYVKFHGSYYEHFCKAIVELNYNENFEEWQDGDWLLEYFPEEEE